jgi:hypothetical protein
MPEENRRRHARFDVHEARVELRRVGLIALLGGKVEWEVVNLADGGIRVAVAREVRAHRKVRVRVRLERFEEPLDVVGDILWCRRDLLSDAGYIVGIAFREVEARQARKIAAMREWFTSSEFKSRRSG